MTKKQLCRAVIQKECGKNVPDQSDVYKSSTIAVAMEYLGLLKARDVKDYAKERGGTVFVYYDEEQKEPCHLSFRELLDLLPE